jgi:hypothetical protein
MILLHSAQPDEGTHAVSAPPPRGLGPRPAAAPRPHRVRCRAHANSVRARLHLCARTSSPPSRLQSLEEIEAILVKAERSMNELKCKIAAETQSIRFRLSRGSRHAVPACSAAPSISLAAAPEPRCPPAAHPVMISLRSTARSLPNSHPTPAWVTQAGRGEHRHCAPAGRANTLLAACHRCPPALGHEVGAIRPGHSGGGGGVTMNYRGSRASSAHRLRISPYAVVLRDGACEVVLAMALPWKRVMEVGGLFKAKSDDE